MSLHQELRTTVTKLSRLAELHPSELKGHADVHLSDVIAELGAIADEVEDIDDPADHERGHVERASGRVEGVALLRRNVVNGTSLLMAPDAGPTLALVVLLDDGGVGWQAPDLSRLDNEQLRQFRERFAALDDVLGTEQQRRGGGR